MNAQQAIECAAGKFDTPALAILTRCEQSGVMLRMEGEHLKAKGNRETIAAWQAMIQRHKREIMAILIGQPSLEDDTTELATLRADYEELTACISELCQLAGYSDEARDRTVVRRLARQLDFDVIDIAPAPSLGRVVALDDGMTGRFKVPPRMTVGRVVAATDMPATAAKSQMHPG